MRICSPPSIRHWIRQRKADQTGLSQFRQRATALAPQAEKGEAS
jgi:hypothetical protein